MTIKYESLNEVDMWAFSRFVRYFHATSHFGTMRRAGDELHVSPSSIDRQILSIEEKLGVSLFERLPSGLRLTTAGELVLYRISRWQKEMRLLQTQIEELKGLHRGHISIAFVEGIVEWASSVLAEFHQRYPNISYDIQVHGADKVARLVATNTVDIGLSINPSIMSGLNIISSIEFRMGIIASPRHPLAKNESIRLSDCIDYGFIIPDTSLALRGVIDHLMATSNININVAAISNSLQTIKKLVSQDMGLGLATYIDVANEVERGELYFIPLMNKNIHPSLLSLCLSENRQPPQITTEVIYFFDKKIDALTKQRPYILKGHI